MPKVHLSIESLKAKISKGEINTVTLLFTNLYGFFLSQQIDANFFIDSVLKNGRPIAKCVIHSNNLEERMSESIVSDEDLVFGDYCLRPDLTTLRVASWLNKTAIVIGDLIDGTTQELVSVAPRTILHRQYKKIIELNFAPKAASELEYYLFAQSYEDLENAHYHSLKPWGHSVHNFSSQQANRKELYTQEARHHLSHSGISVEASRAEAGNGQHEINIAYAPLFEMADNHAIYKECLKEIAEHMNFSLTFMAKPFTEQMGSSCHVHISLWQGNTNCFSQDKHINDPHHPSILKWFLGGMMNHVPEFMVFYAPNINSYKRYQEKTWVPLTLSWSMDNRSAAFRIVGQENALRIEFRLPGADCNPYLVYAAILASGIDGLINKTMPPAAQVGDCARIHHTSEFPMTLQESIEYFSNSAFARETFGNDVVEHYLKFFRSEIKAFQSTVTDWEIKRYFEQS